MQWGEQPGWIYNPWKDEYNTDPRALKDLYTDQGLIEKDPSMMDQLIPIAAGAGATALATEGGRRLISGEGLFGIGGKEAATTTATEGGGFFSSLGNMFGGSSGVGGGGAGGVGTTAVTTGLPTFGAEMGAAYGGTATGAAAAPSGFLGLGGSIGAVAPYAMGAAGAYGLYDTIKDGKGGVKGGLQGAASGAALGTAIAPGIGTAIGAGVGGLLGLVGGIGDKDRWKTERTNLEKLRDKGVYVPPEIIDSMPTRGRTPDELEAIAKATGNEADVKFARSRNINDLKGSGQSIVGYSAFAEKDPEWYNRPLDQRIAYANQLLDAGLVTEGRGTIKLDSKAPPPPWMVAPGAPGTTPPALPAPAQSTKPATAPAGGLMGIVPPPQQTTKPAPYRR
jgi:hypothetical protein